MSRIQLNRFEYFEPDTVNEATGLLEKYGDEAKVIAGGIDLIPKMRTGSVNTDCLISIRSIKDLTYFRYDDDCGLEFGAMTALKFLDDSMDLKEKYPAVQQAIHQITSAQSKYMGTAVGNLCVATPGSDVAPALMAYDAEVLIAGPEGERKEKLCNFYPEKSKTALKRGEFVTGVYVPAPAKATGAAFMNRVRTHADIAKVTLTAVVSVDGDVCTEARIALGSVAPTPVRAYEAEEMLRGQKISDLLNADASTAVLKSISPISDFRSTMDYRAEVTPILAERALHKAFEMARRVQL